LKDKKGRKILDLEGKEIGIGDIKDGLWIKCPDRSEHGLHDTIPRECDECGFPAMEILSKDFENQQFHIGCPWCHASRRLCLVCGKMAYLLGDHKH